MIPSTKSDFTSLTNCGAGKCPRWASTAFMIFLGGSEPGKAFLVLLSHKGHKAMTSESSGHFQKFSMSFVGDDNGAHFNSAPEDF